MRLTQNQINRIINLDQELAASPFGKSDSDRSLELIRDVERLLEEVITTRMEPRRENKRVDSASGVSYLGGERKSFVRAVFGGMDRVAHITVHIVLTSRFREDCRFRKDRQKLKVSIEVPFSGEYERSWKTPSEQSLLHAFEFICRTFAPYEPDYKTEEALKERGKPYLGWVIDADSRQRIESWLHKINFPNVLLDHVILCKTGETLEYLKAEQKAYKDRRKLGRPTTIFVLKDTVCNPKMQMVRVLPFADRGCPDSEVETLPIIVSMEPDAEINSAFSHDRKESLRSYIEGESRSFQDGHVLVKGGFPVILYDYSGMPPVEGEGPPPKEPPVQAEDLINEAAKLLSVARDAMMRLRLEDQGHDVRLSHEERVFAQMFSKNDQDEESGSLRRGTGEFHRWQEQAQRFAEQHKRKK